MQQLTVTELVEILTAAAGADEGIDMTGDVADTDFEQLGYESLAILEAAGAIERRFAVVLDEDALFDANTPGSLVDLVNRSLLEQAA